VVLKLEPFRLISVYVGGVEVIWHPSAQWRFSMKLVTAMSTAALVLIPAVGFAQDPGNGARNTKDEPGIVDKAIGTVTGRTPDTKKGADAKSDRDSAAKSAGDTDYPDRAKVKKTDK
jgi:hypothetical protein